MPQQIGALTLYQYDMYVAGIAKVERILNPQAGGKEEYEYGVDSADEGDREMDRIVKTAETFGIKPPKYQPDRW